MFSALIIQRLFLGIAAVILSVLLVILLYDSPITGALEAETLRWRFEAQHYFSGVQPSKDIVVVYVNSKQAAMPVTQTEAITDDVLASLLLKIEQARPTVIGVNLAIGKTISPTLRDVLITYSNIVLGLAANLTDSARSSLARHCGSTDLEQVENGMVVQLPQGEIDSGAHGGSQTFCRVLASIYRPSKSAESAKLVEQGRKSSVSHTGKEPIPFINYSDVKFDTLDYAAILSPNFDSSILRNKIVLLGENDSSYIIPAESMRIHKLAHASEVVAQAYAIQTTIDGSAIRTASRDCFRSMLYVLALIGFLMPVWAHRTRCLAFGASFLLLLFGSYIALVWWHVFIQVWPFLIGLFVSFIVGTIAYGVTDLQERNRQLVQTQIALEKRNIDLEDARTELQKRNKEIAQARELGMEEERKRIASDLHDDALSELFLASSIVENLKDSGVEPSIGKELQNKLHETSNKIRHIMANLSPSVLSVCGLTGAIENLADTLRKETSIEVSFESNVSSELDALAENQALLIYRIVQEAINNIQKHSKASKATIILNKLADKLEICVADNGIGFDSSSVGSDSYGLNNMRYRAELFGATISWNKSEHYSGGTQIILQMQLPLSI